MLTDQNYIDSAKLLNCEVAVIKAVAEVESSGNGFDSSGHIVMLFEPYIFYKELKRRGINPDGYLKKFPTLVSDKWNPKLYGPRSEQWNKLQGASNICTSCAYRATSFGMFQVMGNNAEMLGFKDVFGLYYYLRQSEENQLEIFCKYVTTRRLDDELRNKQWKLFAAAYNGPFYYKNNYDKKLEEAYAKFGSQHNLNS